MNENQAERIALAFESMAKTLEKWYNAEHPAKKPPVEATVTYVKGPEEALEEDLGSTGESTTEEWTNLGSNERDFLEKSKK